MKESSVKTSYEQNTHIGGKAYNLLKMQKAGLKVPPFFILSDKDLELIFGHVFSRFNDYLSKVSSPDDSNLPAICDALRDQILNVKFSQEYSNDILLKCKKIFGHDFCIAVRSSALSEDTDHTSFAGQHSTFLYCSENIVLQKIKECLASAWSFGAISYRLIHGIPITNIKYAIILQKMEFAERSGICFSMNSTGNLADTVINAGYGIGEGIVSDKVEADTYFVNRSNKSITKRCVLKKSKLLFDRQIVAVDVPEKSQNKPALNDDEILKVYDLALRAESILGKPADIEFLFSTTGELFILQMRAITTIDSKNIIILDNTNIVESYPGITLPLSYSFAANAYANIFRRSAKAFWISAEKFNRNHNVFDNLLFHFHGRVYYRLDNWYRMMALVYNSKKSMRAWENAVGLPDSASNSYRFSLLGKIKTIISSTWLILNYRKGHKIFFKYFDINYNLFQQYENHLQSPAILWNYFDETIQKTFQKWHLSIVNDYLAFKSFGWLQDLIKRYKISENPEFANELICGNGEVESEIAIVSLLDIKDMIISSAELSTLFSLPDNEIWVFIKEQKLPEFTSKWNAYLQRFGDRTLAELKLETKSPRKNPELLIQLLKHQLNAKLSAKSFRNKQQEINMNANAKVKEHLKWYMPKHWLFTFILKLTRYGLMNRENMRFCRTRMYSASRDIFAEFGKMMVTAGIIDNEDDIFFLSMNEVKEFCTNNSHEPKRKKIIELKEKFASYSRITWPDRIMYSLNDAPDFTTFIKSGEFNIDTAEQGNHHSEVSTTLRGIAVSKGLIEGTALVITEPVLNANVKGKILVTKMTDPGWVFLMSQSIALVSEKGSLLSHTAIVGRELGIPVVVGVQDVLSKIRTGQRIRVNGSSGIIELLES